MPYAAADKIQIPASLMTPTNNTLLNRRGSLIQRRNSKRFVLSELAAAAAAPGSPPPVLVRGKSVDNEEDKDFDTLADEDTGCSDDDDTVKVPDIVLDIRETSSPIPVVDSSEPHSPEVLDYRWAKYP